MGFVSADLHSDDFSDRPPVQNRGQDCLFKEGGCYIENSGVFQRWQGEDAKYRASLVEGYLEKACEALSKTTTSRDNNKRIQTSLDLTLSGRNEAHKNAEKLQGKLDEAVMKHKSSRHKLRKVKDQLQKHKGSRLFSGRLLPRHSTT